MRALLTVLALLSFSCRDASAPLTDLSGSWAAPYSVPGSSLQFTLSQTADSLSGAGAYSIEAGRAGTLELTGAYTRPSVRLSIRYDFGSRFTFSGRVEGARMVGVIADSTGHTWSASFRKQ
jgi:hypothetical protein